MTGTYAQARGRIGGLYSVLCKPCTGFACDGARVVTPGRRICAVPAQMPLQRGLACGLACDVAASVGVRGAGTRWPELSPGKRVGAGRPCWANDRHSQHHPQLPAPTTPGTPTGTRAHCRIVIVMRGSEWSNPTPDTGSGGFRLAGLTLSPLESLTGASALITPVTYPRSEMAVMAGNCRAVQGGGRRGGHGDGRTCSQKWRQHPFGHTDLIARVAVFCSPPPPPAPPLLLPPVLSSL